MSLIDILKICGDIVKRRELINKNLGEQEFDKYSEEQEIDKYSEEQEIFNPDEWAGPNELEQEPNEYEDIQQKESCVDELNDLFGSYNEEIRNYRLEFFNSKQATPEFRKSLIDKVVDLVTFIEKEVKNIQNSAIPEDVEKCEEDCNNFMNYIRGYNQNIIIMFNNMLEKDRINIRTQRPPELYGDNQPYVGDINQDQGKTDCVDTVDHAYNVYKETVNNIMEKFRDFKKKNNNITKDDKKNYNKQIKTAFNTYLSVIGHCSKKDKSKYRSQMDIIWNDVQNELNNAGV